MIKRMGFPFRAPGALRSGCRMSRSARAQHPAPAPALSARPPRRSNGRGRGLGALLAGLLLLASPLWALADEGGARNGREGREALFRLEADQRAYVQSLQSLPPDRRLELESRLLRQRLRQNDLRQTRLAPDPSGAPSAARPSPQTPQAERGLRLERMRREQDTLRFEQRIQRGGWPYPRWWE